MFYKRACNSITQQRNYTIRNLPLQANAQGYLIKCRAGTGLPIREKLKTMVEQHADSMFIFTSPTVKLVSEYGSFPWPGHSFVFISNQEKKIQSCMSKRQDPTKILRQGKRAADPRFVASWSPAVKISEPRFTHYEEELDIWEKRAMACQEYPLFIHILPLNAGLGINARTFQENVENFIETNAPYALHSTRHPVGDHLIPAANCNGAIYEVILGKYNALVQEMFCQEAVMAILKHFVADWESYQKLAEEIGLTMGIEPSLLTEEAYRPAFTC